MNKKIIIPLSLLLCLAFFGGCSIDEQKCKNAVESHMQGVFPTFEIKKGEKWAIYEGEKWSDFKSENGTTNSGKEYKYRITHTYRTKLPADKGYYNTFKQIFYLTEKFEVVDSEFVVPDF